MVMRGAPYRYRRGHTPLLIALASVAIFSRSLKRLTFAQAIARDNADLLLVQKSRLFRTKQALWRQIEAVV